MELGLSITGYEHPQAADDLARLAPALLHQNVSSILQSQDQPKGTNKKHGREEPGDSTQEDGPTPPRYPEAQKGPHSIIICCTSANI